MSNIFSFQRQNRLFTQIVYLLWITNLNHPAFRLSRLPRLAGSRLSPFGYVRIARYTCGFQVSLLGGFALLASPDGLTVAFVFLLYSVFKVRCGEGFHR